MNRLITRNNKYYNYKDNYCVKCKLYQTSLNHKDVFFFARPLNIKDRGKVYLALDYIAACIGSTYSYPNCR